MTVTEQGLLASVSAAAAAAREAASRPSALHQAVAHARLFNISWRRITAAYNSDAGENIRLQTLWARFKRDGEYV